MVYPVASGAAQQIPAATTFQPGAEQVKRPEQDNRLDSTKASGTETARSNSSEVRNNGQQLSVAASRAEDTGRVSASSSRGISLDITV